MRPGDFDDREDAPRHLLPQPEDVHFIVPDLVKAVPLGDPDGGAGVHPDAYARVDGAKVTAGR